LGLENLKSIFTEGLESFDAPELLNDSGTGVNSLSQLGDLETPTARYMDYNSSVLVGGLFHSDGGKYSTSFKTINIPIGYNVDTGNQIIQQGNIASSPPGAGHSPRNNIVGDSTIIDKFIETSKIQKENLISYLPSGNENGINIDRTIVQPGIPSYNDFVFGNQQGNTGLNETRTINVTADDVVPAQLGEAVSWSALYNSNHSSKENVGYHYSQFVNRDKLNIRNNHIYAHVSANTGWVANSYENRWSGQNFKSEPYIISEIGDGGREKNGLGSRSLPWRRARTDTNRISKFLDSGKGFNFLLKQNMNIFTPMGVSKAKVKFPGMNEGEAYETLIKVPQKYKSWFNPMSVLMSTGWPEGLMRLYGQGLPIALTDKTDGPIQSLIPKLSGLGGMLDRKYLHNVPSIWSKLATGKATAVGMQDTIHQTFNDGTEGIIASGGLGLTYQGLGAILESAIKSVTGGFAGLFFADKKSGSDKMTLAPMLKGEKLSVISGMTKGMWDNDTPADAEMILFDIEAEKYGMPMYFKDLRDNTYIFFRAYIDGLTENITPEWTPTHYIGRSEPVYVYKSAEREITFNLKLFAHSKLELKTIYQKLNRLTSLCYPEYHPDTAGGFGGKTRMKPPLTKFRLGELYGSNVSTGTPPKASTQEVLGFIKTLSYVFDDNSPWETAKGKRVPKFITATIAFQVIHSTVPSLEFAQDGNSLGTSFYGITDTVGIPEDSSIAKII